MASSEAALDPLENAKAEQRKAVSAHVIYESIRREGENELSRTTQGLAFSALAAGLSMGISLLAQGALQAHLPPAEWRPVISKVGYALGFVVVIIGRQQLFTENTLTPIIPLLDRHSHVRVAHVARMWLTVLLANLAGAALFALATAHAPAFTEPMRAAFQEISAKAFNHTASHHFLSAIYAGWLVALIVWLLPAAHTARLWVVLSIAYLIGIGGFAHIIAGAVEVFYLVANGSVPVWSALSVYIAPVLAGNILGGVMLVAVLNYAQVRADHDHEHKLVV